MKADSKSLHARLYKFTYSSDLPVNLCPYFWKLVWGVIILIPNFIIQLPILIYHIFQDKEVISLIQRKIIEVLEQEYG